MPLIHCWAPGFANVAAILPYSKPTLAEAILGPVDALKLRSSMMIFAEAVPDELLFREVLAARGIDPGAGADGRAKTAFQGIPP